MANMEQYWSVRDRYTGREIVACNSEADAKGFVEMHEDPASLTISQVFDSGDTVICDLCGGDFTNSQATGGILFQSKALCPGCASKVEPDAKKYNEEHFIRGRCPEGKTFAAWVREDLRGGDSATVSISYF